MSVRAQAATAPRPPDDQVLPFLVERTGVRGRLLRLGEAVDTIVTRPGYPAPVAALLAELVALTAALASTLKYEGVFTLQVKGDGPVRTMVADMTSEGVLRGYAGYDAEAVAALAEQETPAREIAPWLGAGYLAFTVDQGPHTQRYQGMVELSGPRLADCLLHYFRQSQQINAGVVVAVARAAAGWRAGVILIERVPDEGRPTLGPEEQEAWQHTLILTASCTERELLDPGLSAERLLYRLFHEDGVRVFRSRPLAVGCRCSYEKVAGILRSLPREQVEACLVDGRAVMTCEFCGTRYDFEADELAELYRAGAQSGDSSTPADADATARPKSR